MSAEENKAIVRRFIEQAFNKGDVAAMDAFVSPEMIDYTTPGKPAGRQAPICAVPRAHYRKHGFLFRNKRAP
jgi:predicted SnoaL-like aldol condensation-catalyzing enzyme